MLTPPDTRRLWNVVEFPAAAVRHRIPPPESPRPPRRLWRAIGWGVLALASVLALSIIGTAWWRVHRLSARIERMPNVFSMPEAARPAPVAQGRSSINVLIAGLDGEALTGTTHGARSDAIMVLHLNADRRKAYVVSIPRDAWVPIPGHHDNKVNAAYSLGGPSLFVQTIERLTGLRMNHLVVVDWTGLRRLTDAVGGVPVSILAPGADVADSVTGEVALEFSGADALPYLSERKRLPGGDFDRVKRQQHFLRAFIRQALVRNTLADPVALRALATAAGEAVRVDDRLTTRRMLALAASVRDLRPNDITFLTAPSRGTGMQGDASVVYYDDANASLLWQALARDRVSEFVASHPQLVTRERVR